MSQPRSNLHAPLADETLRDFGYVFTFLGNPERVKIQNYIDTVVEPEQQDRWVRPQWR